MKRSSLDRTDGFWYAFPEVHGAWESEDRVAERFSGGAGQELIQMAPAWKSTVEPQRSGLVSNPNQHETRSSIRICTS
ncbi:hypothetical protein ANANG_G00152230 [Anguilla anguilla]|uniref:Uncharacterized protein n=1 Tax=Anguilla anguilla TaxID=7936 RepID=A0A9D3MD83_ANGAN|nr:hypothetical protein ANANG_G00152230 [Anguilla anguilla]